MHNMAKVIQQWAQCPRISLNIIPTIFPIYGLPLFECLLTIVPSHQLSTFFASFSNFWPYGLEVLVL